MVLIQMMMTLSDHLIGSICHYISDISDVLYDFAFCLSFLVLHHESNWLRRPEASGKFAASSVLVRAGGKALTTLYSPLQSFCRHLILIVAHIDLTTIPSVHPCQLSRATLFTCHDRDNLYIRPSFYLKMALAGNSSGYL